jgi:hypothetical protein
MSLALYDGILEAQKVLQELRSLRGRLRIAKDEAAKAGRPTEALDAFDKEAAALEGGAGGPGSQMGGPMGPGGPGSAGAAGSQDTLLSIGGSLNSLMSTLQASDTAPTSQLSAAVAERLGALRVLIDKFKSLRTRGLAALKGL